MAICALLLAIGGATSGTTLMLPGTTAITPSGVGVVDFSYISDGAEWTVVDRSSACFPICSDGGGVVFHFPALHLPAGATIDSAFFDWGFDATLAVSGSLPLDPIQQYPRAGLLPANLPYPEPFIYHAVVEDVTDAARAAVASGGQIPPFGFNFSYYYLTSPPPSMPPEPAREIRYYGGLSVNIIAGSSNLDGPPLLTIEYTAADVPEPSTAFLSVVALAAIGLLACGTTRARSRRLQHTRRAGRTACSHPRSAVPRRHLPWSLY